jgi:hypothetical protein
MENPQGVEEAEWRFDNQALQTIRTALQLQNDLGLNTAGGLNQRLRSLLGL